MVLDDVCPPFFSGDWGSLDDWEKGLAWFDYARALQGQWRAAGVPSNQSDWVRYVGLRDLEEAAWRRGKEFTDRYHGRLPPGV